MEKDNEMNLILGIGPEYQFADGIKKTLRVGTIKQLKDIGDLYKDGLKRLKAAVFNKDEEQILKWVEILDIICIEGFTREEIEDSVPELVEQAVDRFLFS